MSAKEQVTEILDDRHSKYGEASDTLQLIADYWNAFLHGINGHSRDYKTSRVELTPEQVAQMMVLFKVARTQRGSWAEHGDPTDDMLDTIGYATLAADVRQRALACKPSVTLKKESSARASLVKEARLLCDEKKMDEIAADEIEKEALNGCSADGLEEVVGALFGKGLVSQVAIFRLLSIIKDIEEDEE